MSDSRNIPSQSDEVVLTDIPGRLDRLPWSRFHVLLVFALGAGWAIDGLEVTLKGAISGVLQDPASLHLDSEHIGGLASFYLLGAVAGALICGWLTDRYGRARLFFVTMSIYLAGTLATAFSWDFASIALFRAVTGFGIGGEYAAINSAIDEWIPARVRGRISLLVNGSFWLGAMLGSGATVALLDPALFPVDRGWRIGFGLGALLGTAVLFARAFIPESPRWLVIHGRAEEAVATIEEVEQRVEKDTGQKLEEVRETLPLLPRRSFGFGIVLSTLLGEYRRRAVLGFVLIASQAFLYNAIFFTYALVLTRFYDVPAGHTGMYLLPFAIANFLGPLALGHWFDSIGRRAMISASYALASVLLVVTGLLFVAGQFGPVSQTAAWSVIFFFASAAASSGYLTISEVFPIELRAMAIAVFYALGTGAGGVVAPWLFGVLIGSGERRNVLAGYLFGAFLMMVAAIVELCFGVRAERASLESVARPLSLRPSTPAK